MEALGKFFESVTSALSTLVNFVGMLLDDIVVMSEIAEVAAFIPNTASLLLWSPLSACMGIVLAYSMVRLVMGVLH